MVSRGTSRILEDLPRLRLMKAIFDSSMSRESERVLFLKVQRKCVVDRAVSRICVYNRVLPLKIFAAE